MLVPNWLLLFWISINPIYASKIILEVNNLIVDCLLIQNIWIEIFHSRAIGLHLHYLSILLLVHDLELIFNNWIAAYSWKLFVI